MREKDKKEIGDAFEKTLAVRTKGVEAWELADMYFSETLALIHRDSEGEPHTGLKPSGILDPAVTLPHQSLDFWSMDKVVDVLTKLKR